MEKECKSNFYFYNIRVFSVLYSMDNEYVLSGSEDMNVRIWKSISYKPLGNVTLLISIN